jgi:hypothetical protein
MEEAPDAQQTLIIPWLVVPAEEDGKDGMLLVSAPDGTVFDVPITAAAAALLPSLLASNNLWRVFFTSLLGSLPSE